MPSDTAPFYAGSTISDARYFIGYQEQLDTITARTVAAQPTSINVVGDKRTGKSSLLSHFCQTYEQKIESRGKDPRNYLAVYLSLEQGSCQHKSRFYRVVAEELCKNLKQRYSWFGQPKRLIQALEANHFDTESFSQTIVQFRDVGILPILCLDKIEALFQHPEEFNNGFYDNLRSLMDRNALMLVIASGKNLKVYSRQKKLTSSFFNVGQVMMLQGFTDNEARDLVRLPQTNIPGSQAVLNDNEQQIALDWGGKNPYLLQLAGLYLWEAKQSNNDINWAKKSFERQARGISANHSIWRKGLLFLQWVFWRLPVKLGQAVKFIGTKLDEFSAWLIGVFIVGACILAALKILPWSDVIEAVKKTLGIGE
ncbi:MAG: AAA-like domain-containing protein [Calothrix sp. MO_192.B10]|nr:AAA-like domain-containing protein [Calothrix sp. MO_192.B10]